MSNIGKETVAKWYRVCNSANQRRQITNNFPELLEGDEVLKAASLLAEKSEKELSSLLQERLSQSKAEL